ncbi:MAG: ABC transporter ATP-binding protein [Planctomycetota bacterium]
MIRVDNLVKRFGQTTAVADVSFAVGKGEVVGFLGPNGAGKTTTLRVLTCYHPATSGTASVGGHDVFSAPVEARRQVGYLPENVPIYGDLRVEEYLRYRAALKGVPRRQRRAAVEVAMERADVLDVRRKLVAHVSRGYRQRVGLADALVARPPILILDEPTTGLDPIQRRRMKTLVRDLAQEHTILFSSHILAEVQDVSSRILVIHRGQLRADGAPDELLRRSLGRRLVVTAALDCEALRQVVAGLAGVQPPVDVCETGDGFATAGVEVRPGEDPRDEAFAVLQTRQVRIRELRLQLPTLEEFFVQVTEGADLQASAAEGSAA